MAIHTCGHVQACVRHPQLPRLPNCAGLQGKLSKLNQAYVTMNPGAPAAGLQVRTACSL